jgi:microcystin-dependent protein
MFGGNFAPRGWMLCAGQLLSISQYAALFSILGTTFGGNGTTTFGLPDLRGRVPLNWGQGPALSNYVLGESSGSETVTLLTTQIPAHVHPVAVPVNSGPANQATPGGAIPAQINTGSGRSPILGPLGYTTVATDSTMPGFNSGIAGGSQPHANLQPFLAVTFMIAIVGIFPTRN